MSISYLLLISERLAWTNVKLTVYCQHIIVKMATTGVGFRWLDLLEKEFDKACVELDTSISKQNLFITSMCIVKHPYLSLLLIFVRNHVALRPVVFVKDLMRFAVLLWLYDTINIIYLLLISKCVHRNNVYSFQTLCYWVFPFRT